MEAKEGGDKEREGRGRGREVELRPGRKGGWKEWAGGGREASSDNCVWVQANMRQLPAGPGSLARSGCKAERLVTVPFSSRDAEDQGRL